MKTKQFVVFLVFFLLQTTTNATAAVFYVSSSTGNDNNDGLSRSTPWQTTENKVNKTLFAPGDKILFKRGDTWNFSLDITSSGTEEAPITFSSYGEGPKPIIHATTGPAGNHSSVRVNGANYIIIDSLEVSGTLRYGIAFYNNEHLTIQNCYVHHILSEDWHCVTGHSNNLRIINNEIAYCGLEGYYGSGENIEIAYNYIHHTDMVSETNNCNGGGDVIHLNCWTPDYHVHHNTLDHSNTCGPKGAFISSHCTLACYNNPNTKCTDEISVKTSNGLFEHNTIISGPRDNFGFTNSGYGDTVRFNSFKGQGGVSEFALKSERGVLLYHNTFDSYGTAISLGKDDGTFDIYNNLVMNTEYAIWGSNDDRRTTVTLRNNLFLNYVQYTRSNSNQVITFSHNISTSGFGSGASGSPALVDQGNNRVIPLADLHLVDPANGNYHPLKISPAVQAGVDVGLPYSGSAPTIGPYEYNFPWLLFLPPLFSKE